jgi:hypothetical protein
MKQSATLARVQENMAPGVLTAAGFLGNDRRALAEILDDDAARVQRLGLTHADLAARMRALRRAGASGLGEAVDVAPHFEVRVDGVRGRLACPFGHKGLYAKVNITVRNTTLGEEVTYTDLAIHLIDAHGFYEGRKSLFRLDPETLARVLEIEPQE